MRLDTIPKPKRGIAPTTRFDVLWRKMKLLLRFLSPVFRRNVKSQINAEYRRFLAEKNGISTCAINSLVDWEKLNLSFSSPTSNMGQVSHLELFCIVGIAKEFLQANMNFLEIGTYDGNTALNVGLNIDSTSKVITVDLPEVTDHVSSYSIDDYLIQNENRKLKKHLHLENTEQIYCDSTLLDFSQLTFNGAFIDGGHDFETVRSDTLNVLNFIKKPAFILWHDYDVECELGDLLHHLAKDYPIQWIEKTRLAFLKLDG